MGPGHSFLPRNDATDELSRLGALLVTFAIPCDLSLLVSTLVSDWIPTVSSKFFDTHCAFSSSHYLI